MLFFANDYGQGAHPKVLEKLVETNMEAVSGYGTDRFCKAAEEKIRQACQCPKGQVRMLVGGTQTNQTVIAALLQPYQGVLSADSGHINVHEAGAIESTGHKVMPLPAKNGKICAEDVDQFCTTFYEDEGPEHMVYPGMVYISQPTELGTLYTLKEMQDLHAVAQKYKIPLFVDGARLGYGLMSDECDMTLPEFADACDVFYIGGTKVGALCGEAVVFPHGHMPHHFTARVKQHGALLAKGRLLGVQFDALFTDNLYLEISKNAIDTANRLKEIFKEKGYEFFIDSPTNQQFVIVPNETAERIRRKATYTVWEKRKNGTTVLRFVTSWGTTMEDVEALGKLL